jgi:hypothetical protein
MEKSKFLPQDAITYSNVFKDAIVEWKSDDDEKTKRNKSRRRDVADNGIEVL